MKIEYYDYGAKKRPHRGYDYDAGMDIHLPHDVEIKPNETVRIPLGFGLKIPPTYMGVVIMRSSYAVKGLVGGFSAIDSTYNGEISLIVTNCSNEVFKAKEDERICSLIMIPVVIFDWTDHAKERGGNRTGSTGKFDMKYEGNDEGPTAEEAINEFTNR